jgi:hypothetical protein
MRRAHSVVLSLMADSTADLAAELHALAHRIARGDVSNGRITKHCADMTFVYAQHETVGAAPAQREQPLVARQRP